MRKVLVLSMLALLPACVKISEPAPVPANNKLPATTTTNQSEDSVTVEEGISLADYEAVHGTDRLKNIDGSFLIGECEPFESSSPTTSPDTMELIRYLEEHESSANPFYPDNSGMAGRLNRIRKFLLSKGYEFPEKK